MAKPPRYPQNRRLIELGARLLGFWLLAAATAPAAQSAYPAVANNSNSEVIPREPATRVGGYLPAVGAAPLRFDSPAAGGQPDGLLLSSLRVGRGTNMTAPATNAPASSTAGATNEAALTVTAAGPKPSLTASADTNHLALPPMGEQATAAITVTDLQSVLKWLLPTSANVPEGGRTFPTFAPATPPRSSKATYQNR